MIAPIGTVFPPRDAFELMAYDLDQVVEGWLDYDPFVLPPGENHDPGYRWGWANARRTYTKQPDGYDSIRQDYIKMKRMPN